MPNTGVRNVHAASWPSGERSVSVNHAQNANAEPTSARNASDSTNLGVQSIRGRPSTAPATTARTAPPIRKCQPAACTTSMPARRRDSSVPAVMAAAARIDSQAPDPPPPGTATTSRPANPTTSPIEVRAVTRSP